MYYYEYLIYPFIVAAVGGVGYITWKFANADWTVMPNKDPRWKNRNKIVDFIFTATTVYTTLIVAIVGGMTI